MQSKHIAVFVFVQLLVVGLFVLYFQRSSFVSVSTSYNGWSAFINPLNEASEIDFQLLEELQSYSGQEIINNLQKQAKKNPLEPTIFASTLQCSERKIHTRLNQDLNYWFHSNPFISEEMFLEPNTPSYLIYSQKLYKLNNAKTNKEYEKSFVQLLMLLLKVVTLDNVLFSVDLGDGRTSVHGYSFPTLTATKITYRRELLIPNFDTIQRLLNTEYPLADNLKFLQKSTQKREDLWNNRKNIAFWRGGNLAPLFKQEVFGTYPRYRLVEISKRHPEWVDAGFFEYYRNFPNDAKRNEVMSYFGTVPKIQLSEAFSQYNYMISVDGYIASWKVGLIMASPSLLLKQESKDVEHFYADMKPWEHYVPVNVSLSNLIDRVQFLRENPNKAKQIVNNQMRFARQNLLVEGMLCYMYDLLNGLAVKQKHFQFSKYANETLLFNEALINNVKK